MVERKHPHLDTARYLLLKANVPLKFLLDAILMASYLINRMPSSVLNNQVPHSTLFPDESPNKLRLCIFVWTSFVHDISEEKTSSPLMQSNVFFHWIF